MLKLSRGVVNRLQLTFEENGVETTKMVIVKNERELHDAIGNADRNTLVEVDIICPQITRIGSTTFQALPKLRSISLPSSVDNIDPYAFLNCHNLQRVDLSENVETIEVRFGSFAKQTLHKPFKGLVDLLKEGFPATMNPDDSWSRWD